LCVFSVVPWGNADVLPASDAAGRSLTVILNEYRRNNPIHFIYQTIEMFNETQRRFGVWKFVKRDSAIPVKFLEKKKPKFLCRAHKKKRGELCKNNRMK